MRKPGATCSSLVSPRSKKAALAASGWPQCATLLRKPVAGCAFTGSRGRAPGSRFISHRVGKCEVGQAGSLPLIVDQSACDQAKAARGRLSIGGRLSACPTLATLDRFRRPGCEIFQKLDNRRCEAVEEQVSLFDAGQLRFAQHPGIGQLVELAH